MTANDRACAVRAGYGALLLLAPGTVGRLYSGRPAGPTLRRVARVLGLRHLSQALLSAGAAGRSVLALGAEVDAAHSTSMLIVAATDGRYRRAATVDGMIAGGFAAMTVVLAKNASVRDDARSGGLRERLATAAADRLVPRELR